MAAKIRRKSDGTPDLRFGANRTKRNTTRSTNKTNKRATMRGGARGR